jgi:uncharacterized protein (DUF488 family)
MIKLFTIGFTGKTAEKFFTLLKEAGVKKIMDIRLNNVSQLAGFAKGTDLKYFADKICGISYEHRLELAPSKELLNQIRNKEISWKEWERNYLKLIKDRKILDTINIQEMNESCLLCSEDTPEHCHRSLLAGYLERHFPEIKIIHL